MKPKTVGRVMSGQSSPTHAQNLCHGIPVGVPVLTADGALPVEFLTPGDRVVTRNGGLVALDDVQSDTISTRGIKFAAGCFGRASPESPVVLPNDQPVLLRDHHAQARTGQNQMMTLAGLLVDDAEITDIGPRRMTVFRLVFERPRVIYVAGLELGTAADLSDWSRRAA